MKPTGKLALIGSGPSTVYLLKHFFDHLDELDHRFDQISIFEKGRLLGVGMPYSPDTTDRYNLSNISSVELPDLPVSLVDWLRAKNHADLESLGLGSVEIDEEKIYPRLILGRYLMDQYENLIHELRNRNVKIEEFTSCEITDIKDDPASQSVMVETSTSGNHRFDRVVIATGHTWAHKDLPESGYYASPWPIAKLLPEPETYHNFPIGTLGASLSAFDVVNSLAHRHGKFLYQGDRISGYEPFPGTEDFKILMHSSQGWLPHLQFDQAEPLRDIYRHADRETMLGLVDDEGFLRIENYFDKVCRPALTTAFHKDKLPAIVAKLSDPEFKLEDFVEEMSERHEYDNAFEGMRIEMVEARRSVDGHQPLHWKETIDDLIYALNFHAELMPAEDHYVLHSTVMPFLMNVVAAMPIESGEILLALYDAGKIGIIPGNAEIEDHDTDSTVTKVTVDDEGEEQSISYQLFIDCSGQKPLVLEDFPFPKLVNDGTARKARAEFQDPENGPSEFSPEKQKHIFQDQGKPVYHTGGIDIDGAYRLVGSDGNPNPRIHDVAFPHTSGARPYSYGLQSCSDTGAIVIRSWIIENETGSPAGSEPEELTEIYEEI